MTHDPENHHVREALAAYAHQTWFDTTLVLLSQATLNADGTATLPARLVGKWKHHFKNEYSVMTDDEKKTLREEADVILEIIRQHRPTIVCLCGSTRFWKQFQISSLDETMKGNIVLSIGAASGTDDDHFGNLPREEYDRVKKMLDELHMRKIELADEVLILNVGGYMGESTLNELSYALQLRKPIRFLETTGAV